MNAQETAREMVKQVQLDAASPAAQRAALYCLIALAAGLASSGMRPDTYTEDLAQWLALYARQALEALG